MRGDTNGLICELLELYFQAPTQGEKHLSLMLLTRLFVRLQVLDVLVAPRLRIKLKMRLHQES